MEEHIGHKKKVQVTSVTRHQ